MPLPLMHFYSTHKLFLRFRERRFGRETCFAGREILFPDGCFTPHGKAGYNTTVIARWIDFAVREVWSLVPSPMLCDKIQAEDLGELLLVTCAMAHTHRGISTNQRLPPAIVALCLASPEPSDNLPGPRHQYLEDRHVIK